MRGPACSAHICGSSHGDLKRMFVTVVQVSSLTCQKVFENKPVVFFVETIDVEITEVCHDCYFKVTWILYFSEKKS